MEVVVADRWTPGSLADRISRLVWGVDDYNRDEVRDFADEVQALQKRLAAMTDENTALWDRIAALESSARRLRAEEREAATAEERRAVVAWLKRLANESTDVGEFRRANTLRAAADSIERGEHVAEGESDE
jgi:predicted RNase H-like nuclease (RuvC/YqgF family)